MTLAAVRVAALRPPAWQKPALAPEPRDQITQPRQLEARSAGQREFPRLATVTKKTSKRDLVSVTLKGPDQ
eukprot:676755-Rhodomonas_salina.1